MIHLVITSLLTTLVCFSHPIAAQTPTAESQQTELFIKRWTDERFEGFLGGAFWSFIHGYSDFKTVEQTLITMEKYFEALEKYKKGDPSALNQMGGIKAFNEKIAALLDHWDESARGFAATVLGVSGDRAYAPQIAKLLTPRSPNDDSMGFDRAHAAIALGLLEAKEHAEAVARLLKDKDSSIREAARESLRMMGASELIK